MTKRGLPAARPAGLPRRLRDIWQSRLWAPTREVPSDCRLRFAAWSALKRPTARYRAPALSPWPQVWTRSDLSQKPWKTRRYSSRRLPGKILLTPQAHKLTTGPNFLSRILIKLKGLRLAYQKNIS